MQQAAAEAAAQTQQTRSPRGSANRRDGGRPARARTENQEDKQFDERVVHIDRVARVVKGGRRFRFRALVVVGDRKGKVGIGSAKGADVTAAITKATDVAKKHFIPVVLYKGTLPHEVEAKVSGARILILPAAPGTGLIAGGVVRTVLEVAGVSNALSKSLGSSNKTNIAYATIAALQDLEPSKNWVTTKHKSQGGTAKKTEKVAAKDTAAKPKSAAAQKSAATKKAAPANRTAAKKSSTKKESAR
ncbi:30S ribosomal protein S5 [Candidatus Saccharibacteria bacterium]|nr:MAG: 30S ribosomal protein S5 [Candidatus Saccharibacteria bacterium]PID99592.1 MAG: 30S ribosomal protein S5 [Candidatus Saccharibacteria bacterium]